jgi:hypothetical protein
MTTTEKTWTPTDAALRDVYHTCASAIEDGCAYARDVVFSFDADIDHVCTLRHIETGRVFSVRIHEVTP